MGISDQKAAPTIDTLFGLLDEWRHLPNYQMERRADIFFALYLPDFIRERFSLSSSVTLVPEFPVHMGTIYPLNPINRSYKIDYLAVTDDLSYIALVELKTDYRSRRDGQDEYLALAARAGIGALLDGLLKIVQATQFRSKYGHLLSSLERLRLLEVAEPSPLASAPDWERLCGNTSLIKAARISCSPKVLYLQPQPSLPDDIGFDEFAAWLDRYQDPLARRFQQSIRRWIEPM
jgi:hypothetical protein